MKHELEDSNMALIQLRLYEKPEVPRFAKGGLAKSAEAVRSQGRFGDEILIHVNPDEFKQMQEVWGEPTVNPHTGLPEYGFLSKVWKKVKKVFKSPIFQMLAPIALNFIAPGLGAAIGGKLGLSGALAKVAGKGIIGAGLGALGGGKKGALSGALLGGMQGGAGSMLGSKLGLTGAGSKLLGNSLLSGAASSAGGGKFGQGALSGGLATAMGLDFTDDVPAEGLPKSPITGASPVQAGLPETVLPDVEGQVPMDIKVPDIDIPEPKIDIPEYTTVDKLKALPGQFMTYAKAHPVQTALGAAMLAQGAGSTKQAPPPELPAWMNEPLPKYDFKRRQSLSRPNLYTYGEGPENPWYDYNDLDLELREMAQGGRYVDQGTGAGGRDDNIDARLSENEYVFDAETVALLGDGNPAAGAKKLDQMRAAIRKQKGKSLARGKISPNARHAMDYIQ